MLRSASDPVGSGRRAGPARPAPAARWVVTVAALGALAVGCGTSPVRTISSSSAASQITSQLHDRYGTGSVSVRCPDSVPARTGTRFSCPATVDGQAVAIDATVTGSDGSFVVSPAPPILGLADVAGRLEAQIAARAGRRPVVHCAPPAGAPGAKVRVVPVGSSFGCTAGFGDQSPRAVTVTVLDAKGDFSFSLAAAR